MSQRVLLGQHPSLGSGLFVSKPGYDVTNAANENLMFSSADPDSTRFIQSGSCGFGANSTGTQNIAITANVGGVAPIVNIFSVVQGPGGTYAGPPDWSVLTLTVTSSK